MNRMKFSAQPRILVVALRRLGDVLLTTPLIRSLRRAWPNATIDALVFADTRGILEGNPDISGIVTMANPPVASDSASLAARLFRRYDLAISTQTGDRPTTFAILAGRCRAGLVSPNARGGLKKLLLSRSVPSTSDIHRVEEVLRIVDALGVERMPEVVCPSGGSVTVQSGAYAVIHASPMFRYKQWTKTGWRELASALASEGVTVIATGGPKESERRFLDDVWTGSKVCRMDGQLSWARLASLLRGARIYVGPDTSVTHLAAASGCPTVAIYGPTDPRRWGPWPKGGLEKSWSSAGHIQRRANVWLVQNPLPCMPCQLEGCERRLDSSSVCLEELRPQMVLDAVDQALA